MDNKKPKILHITRNLPPLIGGMELLNLRLVEFISKKANTYVVVGPNKSKEHLPKKVIFYGAPLKPIAFFLATALFRAIQAAKRVKPDTVLAGSGLTAPLAVITAWLFNKKSAVYLHGLDIAHQGFIYSLVWLPFIRSSDIVIANSKSTMETAIYRGVPKSRIRIINPGVDYPPILHPNEQLAFSNNFGLSGKKVLISIGRLTERKGLFEFITRSFPLIAKQHPDCVLLIIGSAPINSLSAKEQNLNLLREAAVANDVEDRVIFAGEITDRRIISAALNSALVHVFPVREIRGDPEGFGMVAIEAAAHGVPTVAFKTGGTNESVKEWQSGRLIAVGDYDGFAQAILDILENSHQSPLPSLCQNFAESFAWDNISDLIFNELA